MIIIISRVFEKFGKKPKTEMYTREGGGGCWWRIKTCRGGKVLKYELHSTTAQQQFGEALTCGYHIKSVLRTL